MHHTEDGRDQLVKTPTYIRIEYQGKLSSENLLRQLNKVVSLEFDHKHPIWYSVVLLAKLLSLGQHHLHL